MKRQTVGILVLAALLFFTAWRFLFIGGKIPVDGNVMREVYPNWVMTHTQIRAGVLPLWCASKNMGEPYLADPKSLAAYPLSWFLAFAAPSFLWFFRFWVLLHTLIAGLYMYRLCESARMDRPACWTATVLISLNGFFMVHGTFPNLFASAAYVPAVMYYFRRNAWASMGAALALQWLAGYPPFSVLTGLVLLFFRVALRDGRLGTLIKGGVLAIGLAAYQVLPFMEFLHHSVRTVVVPASDALAFSITLRDLLKELLLPQWVWVAPQLQGDPVVMGFYLGLPALILAGVAVYKGCSRERWLGGAVLLSLLFCLGHHVPGASWFPWLRVLRFPATWLFPAAFALVYLAALGVGYVKSARMRWVICGFIALDLVLFAQRPLVAWMPPAFLTEAPDVVSRMAIHDVPGRVYATDLLVSRLSGETLRTPEDYVRLRDALPPSLGVAYGLREASSYQVMRLRRAHAYLERMKEEGPRSPLLSAAGVSDVVTLQKSAVDGSESIVFIERKDYAGLISPVNPSLLMQVGPVSYRPGHLRAEIFVDQPGEVAFAEVFYPGWTASLNGQPVALRLYLDTFMAVSLPAGKHVLEFLYRPVSFSVGFGISLLAFLVFLAASLTPYASTMSFRSVWRGAGLSLFGLCGFASEHRSD